MVDLAYDWGLMGWGMRAIVIVLAVALILVVLSPHVSFLKPIAEGLGLTTTKTVYVPINHTVVKYVNQTIVKYINQTVPVYVNRTVYVSVNPFHVNYTCHLNIYIFQQNKTVAAYGYMNANLTAFEYWTPSSYSVWVPSCSSGQLTHPLIAAIYSNNSIVAPGIYLQACYNGSYTIFYPYFNIPSSLPPIRPSPAWNGTWILTIISPVQPEIEFTYAIPCNATVYVEK